MSTKGKLRLNITVMVLGTIVIGSVSLIGLRTKPVFLSKWFSTASPGPQKAATIR
jgi:hypothetical protein